MKLLSRTAVALTAAALAAAAGAQHKAVDRAAVEAAFARADANSDGKLTKDEAAKLPEIAARFESIDRNRDGAIDLAEFATGYGPPAT